MLKLIAITINSNGEREVIPVTVEVSEQEYNEGVGYDLAQERVEADGYEYVISVDEYDDPEAVYAIFKNKLD